MQTLLNLLAGVALLVWGTHIVRTGVLRVFGADLRRILARSTSNRASAFLAGVAVTGVVQSSSATALIASSFVSQNLIGLSAAFAIMLGADVGTALLSQLFALDLSWLSPLLIIFGVALFLSKRNTRAGQLGRVAIGLGLMLLALQLVMLATKPITEAQGVRVIFATLSGDPMLDMLIGAAFAVLSWSSLAVVLIVATLAATKVVAVSVALCLVLGANLGSGILALLVNARTAGGGRRVAFGNLIFKVVGCGAFSLALPWVLELIARFDPDVRRQVLDFHVLFNVTLAVVFIGLTGRVANFVAKWLPESKDRVPQTEPRFLDPAALATPALALANAARETLRIGDTIEQMLNGVLELIATNDSARVDEILRLDDDVDRLYTAVKLYLTQVSREALDERDSRRWTEIISLTINLEHVGDILERMIQDLRDKKVAQRLSFSEAGMREITELHGKLVVNLRLGLSVFLNGDVKSAQQLLVEKERFRDLERAYHDSHLDRLAGQTLQSIETSSLHLDLISDMRRINSFFCSTAYPILEQAGQLRKSRLMGATGIYQARPDLARGELASRGEVAMSLKLADIEKLFRDHGDIAYSGEGVTQLEHALQTAQLAETAGAADALITAALLHDLGHLLNQQGDTPTARGIDDQHQYFAIPFIRTLFPPAIVEAIRLHVDAKRALCAMDPDYYEALSEDSKRSLTLQGGIFSPEETDAFLAKPFAEDAMRVRRWDDDAKVAGLETAPLAHFMEIAGRCTIS